MNTTTSDTDSGLDSHSEVTNPLQKSPQAAIHRNDSISSEKMKQMKERFQLITLMDDDDMPDTMNDNLSGESQENTSNTGRAKTPVKQATRWGKLRQAIVVVSAPHNEPDLTIGSSEVPSQVPFRGPESLVGAGLADHPTNDAEEDANINAYWKSFSIPQPAVSLLDIEIGEFQPTPVPLYENVFVSESTPLSLGITRVPEAVVRQQRDLMERQLLDERRELVEKVKSKEMDLLWREHLARLRVEEKELKALERIKLEKDKFFSSAIDREKDLGKSFKRVRDHFEEHINYQNATAKERFGDLIVGKESLGRQLDVYSNTAPQPLELRIHFLRAVKTKLPKGAYVVMATQFESLGGKALWWSKIGPCGLGPDMPSITKPAKHYGRFFDRILRFEDSCFLSCPPKRSLKPSYVIVLEIFHLKNRNNPSDTCVGWTALPMCNESFGVVEGKFRLPFLRGEHSPLVQNFRGMEDAMAKDLNSWLCNGYIEVRHLPKSVVDPRFKETDFVLEYDYFKKTVGLQIQSFKTQISGKQPLQLQGFSESRLVDKQFDAMESQPQSQSASVFNTTDHNIDKGLFRRGGSRISRRDGKLSLSQYSLTSGLGSYDDLDMLDVNDTAKSVSAFASTFGPIQHFSRKVMSFFGSRSHRYSKVHDTHGAHGAIDSAVPLHLIADDGTDDDVQAQAPLALQGHSSRFSALIPIRSRVDMLDESKKSQHQISPSPSPPHSPSTRDRKSRLSSDKTTKGSGFGSGSGSGLGRHTEIFERNQEFDDEFFLHDEERGRLVGVDSIASKSGRLWASAGIDKNFVTRQRSDEPRYDDEALLLGDSNHDGTVDDDADKNGSREKKLSEMPSKFSKGWNILENSVDIEKFSVALKGDPSQRLRMLPHAISKIKLTFIKMELFGDLLPHSLGTMDSYITIMIYLCTLWMRIYIHYIAEYLFLSGAMTPIYGYVTTGYQLEFKYMSSAVSATVEVCAVAIGPLVNILVFLAFVQTGRLFYSFAGFLPLSCSKFIAAFGVATTLDPLLIAIVDLANHNYNCKSKNAECAESYTSSACHCFEGDFIKLWNRYAYDEGSGITGLIITAILYLGMATISMLLLYEYLVYVHRDARILDLWRRINGADEEFFMPDDFEISGEELHSICTMARKYRGLDGSTRQLDFTEYDSESNKFMPVLNHESTKHYRIYVHGPDGRRKQMYRQFVMRLDGSIIEIFDQLHSDVDDQENLFTLASEKDPLASNKNKDLIRALSTDDDRDRSGGFAVASKKGQGAVKEFFRGIDKL